MPVNLKLEEKPTNLGSEVKHPDIWGSGGIAWPSGSWEEKISLLVLRGITRRLPGLLARSLDMSEVSELTRLSLYSIQCTPFVEPPSIHVHL